MITSKGEELRILFSGPSKDLLKLVHESFILDGPTTSIPVLGSGLQAPVFLINSKAKDPDDIRSAECTSSYLVNIRNSSSWPIFIALVPNDEALNKSLDTTTSPLGLTSKAISSFSEWQNDPFISEILNTVIWGYSSKGNNDQEIVKAFLINSLRATWESNENSSDQKEVWEILTTLCQRLDKPTSQFFFAALGLPSECRIDDLENDNLVIKIASVFDRLRFNGAQLFFEENTNIKYHASIEHFCNHIRKKSQSRFQSKFIRNPMQVYSPFYKTDKNDFEIPSWWNELTAEFWQSVFYTAPQKSTNLTISLANPVDTCKGTLASTQEKPRFKISILEDDGSEPKTETQVAVLRSVGQQNLVKIETISVGPESNTWTDISAPLHEKFLRYEFQTASESSKPIRIIEINNFKPGIILNCQKADKITPFVWNPKGKHPKTDKKRPQYECDMHLDSMGSQYLKMHKAPTIRLKKIIEGFDINAEGEGHTANFLIESEALVTVKIITDEDCIYEFCVFDELAQEEKWYVINIKSEENEPRGVTSIFEELVNKNCNTSISKLLQVVPLQNLLTNYLSWAVKSDSSYFPVIFGSDFNEAWREPDWPQFDIISNRKLSLDPRPAAVEFKPPTELLQSRTVIRDLLIPEEKDQDYEIAISEFFELAKDDKFENSLKNYIHQYTKWLEDDYEKAIWFDLISIHERENNTSTLKSSPFCLLISPLHPLKLAWQVNAQVVLHEAIYKGLPCPAASVLNGAHFPQSLALSTKNAILQTNFEGFFSVGTNSDYWSVLWNKGCLDDLSSKEYHVSFKDHLGLKLDGLTSGFTSSQMGRSLDELHKQNPAKSNFNLLIKSGSDAMSDCNDGIIDWCKDNLGSEQDEWSDAIASHVSVYDDRNSHLFPEPSILANLTTITNAQVSWHSTLPQEVQFKSDLTVIAHLRESDTQFVSQGIRSEIDPTVTMRADLDFSASQSSKSFLSRSKVGNFENSKSQSPLQKLLSNGLGIIESKCTELELFDSVLFSPDLALLDDALSTSKYCAVSSSSLDQSCFSNINGTTYLWDYELPNYSRNTTENSGYFLLANETENMRIAVKNSLKALKSDLALNNDQISKLLQEISLRGIPTLKNITSGGTVSFGEVGLLAALKFLQWGFDIESKPGIIPVKLSDTINFIIPSDIFYKRYHRFRQNLKAKLSDQRPDLLVISILLNENHGLPEAIKLTPIEVKTRADNFSFNQEKEALEQAKEFSKFLTEFKKASRETQMWGIAWREMIVSWINYGFRVLGQTYTANETEEWKSLHQSVINSLLNDKIDIEIDQNGRLIAISDRKSSELPNNFSIRLSKQDAAKVFATEPPDVILALTEKLREGWFTRPTKLDEKNTLNPPGLKELEGKELDNSTKGVVDVTELDPQQVDPSAPQDGIRFSVGPILGSLSGEEVDYFPSNTKLNHMNMGIVGDLGTGKTQLIKALIYNLTKNPDQNRGKAPNFLILDYKKDYSKEDFIKKTGAKVYTPFNLPLNLFDSDKETTGGKKLWLERTLFFTDLLDKIYKGIGPVQKENIKTAVRDSFQSQLGQKAPSIYDVFEKYKETVNMKIDAPYSIMSNLVDGEYFKENQNDIIPFSEFLTGIVVIDLSELGQDDRTKNMLVAVFLNMFYEYMLKLEKKPFIGSDPSLRFIDSFLLVDEADNIMKYEFPVLNNLLLQGREFGIGIILASQFLSHFKAKNTDYREPLLTWFLHKVPHVDEKELQALGIKNIESANRISSLEIHECLCKTLGFDGEFIYGTPFYKLE
jgi:DNA phosphorothioation-dependent restriction protein DptH